MCVSLCAPCNKQTLFNLFLNNIFSLYQKNKHSSCTKTRTRAYLNLMELDAVSNANRFIVCQYKNYVATLGFESQSPLDYSLPLILLQLSFISLASMLIDSCLHYLGQTSMVAQIIAGIVIGPSLLAHEGVMGRTLFPARSVVNLETFAAFGLIYFLFAIGVRTDPKGMINPGRRAAILGLSAFVSSMVLTLGFSYILIKFITMEASLAKALPVIAASLSMMAFPNISCLLMELKMCSSYVGRLTVASALFSDIIGISLVVFSLGAIQSTHGTQMAVLSIFSALAFVLAMIYILQPVIKLGIKRLTANGSLEELYVFICFVCTLVLAFASETIGQHFVLGPLIFGLMIPDGPPLGAALISKLDYFVGKFLYPTFLTTSGLRTNIFDIDLRSLLIVTLLVVFSGIIKISSSVCASYFLDLNVQDAILIGLLFNARGACELVMFNLWREAGVLTSKEFALSVLVSVVGTTVIITPLIKFLYNPSNQRRALKRRTIQHSRRGTELRMLVCIHNQESVPSIINLLDVSNAAEGSPIAVIALILVELAGRATPMLISHQVKMRRSDSKSAQVINVLSQYESCNQGCVSVQTFSAVSHIQAMHDDILRVSLEQDTTIIILPFHQRYAINGSIDSVNKGMQIMNMRVMDVAPCSVGILVDRGILTGSMTLLNNESMYHVGVIFIGGADDTESLYYGARMGRRENVTLTVIRFLFFGCDNTRERKQDTNLIDELREANFGNENFFYQEQIVKDGVGLASALRGLGNGFDLLMVGRTHQDTHILKGLIAWSECPELGVVGDILASPDFGRTSSVLIVQQQKLRGDTLMIKPMKPVVVNPESLHSVDSSASRSSVSSRPEV